MKLSEDLGTNVLSKIEDSQISYIIDNIFKGIDLDENLEKGIELYKKLSNDGKKEMKRMVNNMNTDGIFDIPGVSIYALTYFEELLKRIENINSGIEGIENISSGIENIESSALGKINEIFKAK